MTTRLAQRVRFQGAALEVISDDELIADAVGRRLRTCPVLSEPEVDLQLRYLTGQAQTGVSPPGEARPVYDTPAGSVHYWPGSDAITADFGSASMWVEPGAGRAQIRADRGATGARYLASHPLTMVALCELLKRRSRYSLHAAGLSGGKGTVVIAGPSGTGKSTLALALAQIGLGFLSDDTLFLESSRGGVIAHGFSDAVGVTRSSAARFAELSDLAEVDPPAGYRKHLIRVEERFCVSTVSQGRPRWLLFPELVGGSTHRLEPLDGHDAWLRLVPDVLLTHPETTQKHLAAIAALCEQVSAYRICCGTDVQSVARLVAELIG